MTWLIHLTNEILSIVSDWCLDTPNLGLVVFYTLIVKGSIHKIKRTCEIEKDENIDTFDKSNPFNRVRLVSGYSQPWIGFILKDCPMDNVYSTP